MSEFSTANYNINRFDKTAGVPTAQVDKQGEMQTANKWKQIADGIGMFADKGGEAYAAKINRDRRDEAESRRKEIEARKEKKVLSPNDCYEVGINAAKLHLITKNLNSKRLNKLSVNSWKKIYNKVKKDCSKIHSDLPSVIEKNLDKIEKN